MHALEYIVNITSLAPTSVRPGFIYCTTLLVTKGSQAANTMCRLLLLRNNIKPTVTSFRQQVKQLAYMETLYMSMGSHGHISRLNLGNTAFAFLTLPSVELSKCTLRMTKMLASNSHSRSSHQMPALHPNQSLPPPWRYPWLSAGRSSSTSQHLRTRT